MLSFYKLEIFIAASEEGSFSAAADRLYLTQSAVSQHIQDLENSLGTRLFERGRRGVSLTAAGETLYHYAEEIIRLVAEAERQITDVNYLQKGQITIGATPGIDTYLTPQWIQQFRKHYPNLTVSLQSGITPTILDQILRKQVDLGFVEGEININVDDTDLGTYEMQTINMVVVIGQGHRWWNDNSVNAHRLVECPFITRQPNSQTRIWIDQTLKQAGITPQIAGEFDNPESIKQAVISGMGITILPEYTVINEVKAGLVKTLKIDELKLQRTMKLVWNQKLPLSPIAQAFLDLLQTHYNDLPEFSSQPILATETSI